MYFEIEYEPIKKVIIHQIQRLAFDEFLLLNTLGAKQGDLMDVVHWTDGIIYDTIGFEKNEFTTKDEMQGIIHTRCFMYAVSEKYEPYITNKLNNAILPVVKLSTEFHKKLVQFVLQQEEQKSVISSM
jgi:hypothetical protein